MYKTSTHAYGQLQLRVVTEALTSYGGAMDRLLVHEGLTLPKEPNFPKAWDQLLPQCGNG